MLDLGLSDKRVLVTGGTRGIGVAIARSFISHGSSVVITGRQCPDGIDQSDQLEFYKVNFCCAQELACFGDYLDKNSFDIVVNNAGINKINLVENISLEDWDEIIDVNLRVPFFISRRVVANMKSKSWGRIINIASIFGVVSKSQRASYSSSKAGLLGFSRAMALDYAQNNILVNCISPGFIDTELTRSVLKESGIKEMSNQVPMKRLGTTDEIASIVVYFGSEANTFVTGQNIIVDGGFTCV